MAMSITYLVWMIGIHSIIHGIFGIIFVLTTDYVNKSNEINYTLVALYGLLILLGSLLFIVLVCRVVLIPIIFGVLFAIAALAIFIVSIRYTVKYWPFWANCMFDRFLFQNETDCWAGPDKKITLWHIITFIFIIAILLWFYYACLLYKYAKCVCCRPCPPAACFKPPPCPPHPCCVKEKWYKKLLKSKCPPCPPVVVCPPPPTCPPPPPPPCPPPCAPPCPNMPPTCPGSPPPPAHNCPQPPAPPCGAPPPEEPARKSKCPKFVLSFKPGKLGGK